jgi:hypothetical protein
MKKRRFENHKRYLKELGADLNEVSVTGKTHLKMRVTYEGNNKFFILSNTTSDHRSFLNWKCDVRKWINHIKEEPTSHSAKRGSCSEGQHEGLSGR